MTKKKTDKTKVAGKAAGTRKTFPIVGIGASAGGLAAFEDFFKGMPTDTDPGMAFVLVQHLAPDHKSIFADLIQRYTRIKVIEAEDEMVVVPNCIYTIPPNRDMAVLNGNLQLLEPSAPRGQRLPIDFLFRSMAQDLRERAIGVVLSGTGSDGTLGVRAIKGEGGMVMAQSHDTTEYDGMPRSAIATGMVDYELPPAKMPEQLISYAAHAYDKLPDKILVPRVESSLNKIFVILRTQTGHDFSKYKPSTIERRVKRRMGINQINSMETYVKYLQQAPSEAEALFRDLLIGVTSFFRDPEAFRALEEQVMAKLFAGKPTDAKIRVWSPGCATGEEAYSLAILLAEHQETLKKSFKIQVFATDIDSQAIATARTGLYPASIAADISAQRLDRFFEAEPGGIKKGPSAYRIHKTIRDILVFSEQDVIKDPPFSKLDLISCRNLLIYMGSELQKMLIPLFHYALNPNGFLFLGTSETVGDFGDLFTVLDRKLKLYRCRQDFSGKQYVVRGRVLPSLTGIDTAPYPSAAKPAGKAKPPLRELTEQALLAQTVPAAALVNGQGDILYIHGRTGMYLEPAQGVADVTNILKMAREGLRKNLTAALHKAVSSRQTVRRANLHVKTNGDRTALDLTVRPVITGAGATADAPLYLVILAAAQTGPLPAGKAADSQKISDSGTRIATLKQELRAKEEYLQSTTEELETSNEELKSSNEEMQSINEELQSTNEELETSKEELQSVNEELSTVNAELETKVADLSRANNDMNNLLAGTGIGTVFVDNRLHILRFTPVVTRIINLIPADIGRPVGHIVSNLSGYDNLEADTQEVIETLSAKELDVKTNRGKWFTMLIQPYRTLDNVIEGAVLTFVEITEVKKTQDELKLKEERMRIALAASPVAVFNQDNELRYTWIHNPHSGFFDKKIIGKTDADLLPPKEAAKLTAIKKGVIESGTGTRSKVRTTIDGQAYDFDLTVEPLYDSARRITGITCASMDITDRQSKQ